MSHCTLKIVCRDLPPPPCFQLGCLFPRAPQPLTSPLFTLNTVWEERPDTGRLSEDHITVPGSMDTPWLVAHHRSRWGEGGAHPSCQPVRLLNKTLATSNLITRKSTTGFTSYGVKDQREVKAKSIAITLKSFKNVR